MTEGQGNLSDLDRILHHYQRGGNGPYMRQGEEASKREGGEGKD